MGVVAAATPVGGGDSTTPAVFDFMSYAQAGYGLLVPRLQGALPRFAKPWRRRRSLRVFRDVASLSANPHLWSSITRALAAAKWFISLTSLEAAASSWLEPEVAW